MNVLLLISLAILIAAFTASIAVMRRSGETMVLLYSAALVALGALEAESFWRMRAYPLGFDTQSGAAIAALALNALALMGLIALARFLRELERAETLHWESMEGVRGLTELAARRGVPVSERLPMLLELGCARLGLEIGLLSRVRGERYEVVALHAPDDYPVSPGDSFRLDETPCRAALASDRPVAIARAGEAGWSELPAATAFGFEAYLATAIRVGEKSIGTLVFASRRPRGARFTASHKDLLALMAQWLGAEFEREALLHRSRDAAPAPTPAKQAAATPRRREVPAEPRALHLNAILRRLEKRIRRVAGPDVKVVIEPARGLPAARPLPTPADEIVLSLVRRAAVAMPHGGRLTLSTANHLANGGDPSQLPAVAPDRYVTLSVSETGGALDGDALARLFDRDDGSEHGQGRADGGLTLPTLYRLLQRAGGDLSVEAEPGRGSTFTVFLPLADPAPEQAPRPRPRPTAPIPPVH